MKTNIYLLNKITILNSRLYGIIVLENTRYIKNNVHQQSLCYMYD